MKKSVIIWSMKKYENEKQNGIVSSLLGEATSAKSSGLTYSLSALMSNVIAFVFALILLMGGFATAEGFEKSDWYLYCSYLISPVSFGIVAWLILRWQKVSFIDEVKSQKCAPRYFIIAVFLQIGLLSLSELNALFLKFLEGFGYQDSPILLPNMDGFGFVGVLFVIALLPAVFEEVIFRGLLLKGLRPFGTIGAALICGGLFSLYHQNPAQTIYQFCCGVAFALVAIRSGSILPTVISHFLNNALILTLNKFGVSAFPAPVYITVLILSIISLVATMVWLLFFEKKGVPTMKNAEERKKESKFFWIFASVGIVYCAITWISRLLGVA